MILPVRTFTASFTLGSEDLHHSRKVVHAHDPKRVGFWKESKDDSLPVPKARKAWTGQTEFLHNLDLAEDTAEVESYRGLSVCRICHIPNGSREFSLGGWTWPQGFRHYVEKHNIRPPSAFIEFVNGKKP